MAELLRRIWSEDEAQDLAEYVVLAALIAAVVVAGLSAFGGSLGTLFSGVVSGL